MTRLLLDTHVALWLYLGDREKVPEVVATAIADPAGDLLVSVVCLWETAVKRSTGKLPIDDGWRTGLVTPGATVLPVVAAHALAVEDLPIHHCDPFDRILVAQAMVEDAVLVTADRRLDAYDIETLWGERE